MVYIMGEKVEVLNIVDTGTRYGEGVMASGRSAEQMTSMAEISWLSRHGAPKEFSADPEFCKPFLMRFLLSNNVTLNPRPSRSSSMNGIVERNNGVFKNILARLEKETTEASPSVIFSTASLMSNMLHGNKDMSSFQLARGYSPSITGIPSTVVPTEFLDAHVRTSAARAVQRVMDGKLEEPGVRQGTLRKGMRIWV